MHEAARRQPQGVTGSGTVEQNVNVNSAAVGQVPDWFKRNAKVTWGVVGQVSAGF